MATIMPGQHKFNRRCPWHNRKGRIIDIDDRPFQISIQIKAKPFSKLFIKNFPKYSYRIKLIKQKSDQKSLTFRFDYDIIP
ncbi:hypothetical protein A3A05_01980 [Candidatus Nomurabacteria bacterium RIFCSPLOWO2_01_FULL_41_12]|uniref:Uncharacterized protein n=1 Tax=Candidatus Nomurabacteria bacterium RIFCSPLOWO2_01_FULL_41_12 TaxID=1801774 RepID=A0A1F6WWR9_9BACT|nr:MAG: hypothetical protein A3A05_01980 [Candidatus Nomurabacteria bacterium RIFCSPLOWO2_01_FULL_41_12]